MADEPRCPARIDKDIACQLNAGHIGSHLRKLPGVDKPIEWLTVEETRRRESNTSWLREQLDRYDRGEFDDDDLEIILRRAHAKVWCRCESKRRCCGVPGHDHHVSPHNGCGLR